jgi:hypothetical protein
LLITIPPLNTNNYSTAIVDFYAVDPAALTLPDATGQTNVFVQGKTYLGSVIDGSAQDLDSTANHVAYDIGNLNLAGATTVAALVTYSRDSGQATQAGRAVTAIFSNPVTVAPVASPLTVTLLSYSGGSVTFTVTGGTPPYQLQVRTNLTAGNWATFGTPFAVSPITFPAGGDSQGFYRVSGQ